MTDSVKGQRIALWVLKIALGFVFLAAGGAKLAGAANMVEIFEKIGVGQWFRVVTGIFEVGGGVLLLVPRTTFYGAVLLTLIMVGAVIAHLTVLGGNPAPPSILLILSALAAWVTRPVSAKAN